MGVSLESSPVEEDRSQRLLLAAHHQDQDRDQIMSSSRDCRNQQEFQRCGNRIHELYASYLSEQANCLHLHPRLHRHHLKLRLLHTD